MSRERMQTNWPQLHLHLHLISPSHLEAMPDLAEKLTSFTLAYLEKV